MVGRAERDIEMLEKDLEELRRRDEEICQLLQTEDNAHFLQVRGRKREDMRDEKSQAKQISICMCVKKTYQKEQTK